MVVAVRFDERSKASESDSSTRTTIATGFISKKKQHEKQAITLLSDETRGNMVYNRSSANVGRITEKGRRNVSKSNSLSDLDVTSHRSSSNVNRRASSMRHINQMHFSASSELTENNVCAVDKPTATSSSLGKSSLRSILKKPSSPPSNKSVQFVKSGKGDVHYIEKTPEVQRHDLWWSAEDFEFRYEEDMSIVSEVESQFMDTFIQAFDSCKINGKSEEASFDFAKMSSCSYARGLENLVLSEMGDLKQKHRRAVLSAQEQIWSDDSKQSLNDADLTLMRIRSIQYSQIFRLMSLKLAQLDQGEAFQCF